MTAVPGPAPVEVGIRCGGHRHVLSWAVGALTARDHPDPDRERALVALGAGPYRCLDLLDAWNRHADDPDVLVLATRGVADDVRVEPAPSEDEDDQYVAFGSSRPRPGVSYFGGYRPRRRTHVGWSAYSPLHDHGHPRQDGGVETLLTLDRRIADRLVHSVVTTWAQRIADGDPRVPDARPALRAALYGRVVRAVRGWLGDPARPVDVRLLEPGESPFCTVASSGAVEIRLALDWLSEVWLPGLAVTLDRFCLGAAAQTPTSSTLHTVGRDLQDVRTMRVTW